MEDAAGGPRQGTATAAADGGPGWRWRRRRSQPIAARPVDGDGAAVAHRIPASHKQTEAGWLPATGHHSADVGADTAPANGSESVLAAIAVVAVADGAVSQFAGPIDDGHGHALAVGTGPRVADPVAAHATLLRHAESQLGHESQSCVFGRQ